MSTTIPILYSFRRCPYAMRARLAVKASGLQVELREVKLADKPASLFEYSEKGTVPVLVLPDGKVIDESLDVMHCALEISDPECWQPANEEAVEVNHLVAINDGEFKYYLDRYKYSDRYPEHPMEYYRENAEQFIQILEGKLEGRRYLGGEKMNFADVAIFPFIRQFAHVDKAWFDQTRYSNLQAWLAELLQWPMFLSVMDKYKPWRAGDEVILF